MFRNDPDLAAVPTVGTGSLDVAWRTKCGEAVVWDGLDGAALADFLDSDQLQLVGPDLYRKELNGALTPIPKPSSPVVVVKPPAGDWFTVDEATFKSEFASHVTTPKLAALPAPTTVALGQTVSVTVPGKKAPAKKGAAKKQAAPAR